MDTIEYLPRAAERPGVPACASAPDVPSAVPSAPLACETMTTRGLPAHRQFAAWRDLVGPYVEPLAPASAAQGFEATSRAWRFGSFLLSHSRVPCCDYRRTPAQARRDSLEHWLIGICVQGAQRQQSAGTVTEMGRGVPYVFSTAVPFEAQRSGESIEWIGLYLPRDARPQLDGALSGTLNAALTGPMAELLAGLLVGMTRQLPYASTAEAEHLAAAVDALLAGAAAGAEPAAEGPAREVAAAGQLARLRRIIRDNLGSASLSPARLCRAAGVSRSQLYRLFEPFGGVARYIQQERLRFACRLLSDPEDRRGIARIAEAAGIFDPSTFSRAFRQEFGCTPGEVRSGALAGQSVLPAAMRRGGPEMVRSLTTLLRTL